MNKLENDPINSKIISEVALLVGGDSFQVSFRLSQRRLRSKGDAFGKFVRQSLKVFTEEGLLLGFVALKKNNKNT